MQLKYDINALCRIEDKLGLSLFEVMADKNKLASFRVLRVLYWGGLNEDITVDEAGERLTGLISKGTTFMDVGQAIQKALTESGLLTPEGGEKNPPKTRNR